MLIPLPSPVHSTDVITMTTPSGWMMLNNLGVVGAATNLAVTNYTGQSCFGTGSLVKTLKPGVNISMAGCDPGSQAQPFKNMVIDWLLMDLESAYRSWKFDNKI